MTMAKEEKKSSKRKPADGPYGFLRLALSHIILFAAVSYVLGRLRVGAYYNTLGISPGLLSFSPEDYMFSIINLVIICVIVSFVLYLYYRATVGGARMFLAFPLYPDPKNRQEKIVDIVEIAAFIGLAVYVLVNFYLYEGWSIYIPGFTGIVVGGALGIAIILYISYSRWSWESKTPYTILILGVLILIVWLPSTSGTLAKIEVKADVQTFPKAVLICEDALAPQLQSSPQSPNESVEVKIIVADNDMTYVLKQDIDSDDKWQVYGIQNRNIETIVFAGESG